MSRIRAVLVAATCVLLAVLTGCSSSTAPPSTQPGQSGQPGASSQPSQLNDSNGAGPYEGIGLVPAQPRPSFTLTDEAGAPFSFGQRTAGHPTLLYFGYTNCPDVCPATMADISLALKSLPQALQRETYVVFVSTDVEHDTGPVIKRWLSNFSPNTSATFVGLRGTQAQIDAAQTAAHVTVAEDSGQTHSAVVLLYGHDDYARVSFAVSNNEQAQIAHDVPVVARA